MSLKIIFKKIVTLLSITMMLSIPVYVLGEDNTSTAKITTVITWTNPTDKPFGPTLGGPHELSISLTDANGNPLTDKSISWETFGANLSQKTTLTDQNGVSKNNLFLYHRDVSETYTLSISIRFEGDDIYGRSSYDIKLKCYDIGPPTPTPMPKPSAKITPGPEILDNIHSILGFVSFEEGNGKGSISLSDFDVNILGTSNSTKTQENGYFCLDDVYTAGLLRISKPGFISREVQLENFLSRESIPKDFPSRGRSVKLFAGDINQDNTINMNDIIELAKCFGSSNENDLYNEVCDFNKDQVVNFSDVIIVAKNFNKTSSDYMNLSPNFSDSYYWLDFRYEPVKINPESVTLKAYIYQNKGINAVAPVWIEYWNASDYKVVMTSSDMLFSSSDYIERTLTGLKPGTTYWYQVRSVVTSGISSFTTMSSDFQSEEANFKY